MISFPPPRLVVFSGQNVYIAFFKGMFLFHSDASGLPSLDLRSSVSSVLPCTWEATVLFQACASLTADVCAQASVSVCCWVWGAQGFCVCWRSSQVYKIFEQNMELLLFRLLQSLFCWIFFVIAHLEIQWPWWLRISTNRCQLCFLYPHFLPSRIMYSIFTTRKKHWFPAFSFLLLDVKKCSVTGTVWRFNTNIKEVVPCDCRWLWKIFFQCYTETKICHCNTAA